MHKYFFLLLFGIGFSGQNTYAQAILPNITVKNYNNKIIVSWRNEYPLEVKTINIQRSYDSSKNFSTIGTVLNPQNNENGFVDENPPYIKMYYRVFLAFDAGTYIFSESVKPSKDLPPPLPLISAEVIVDPFKKADALKEQIKDDKKVDPDTKEPPVSEDKAGKKPVENKTAKEKKVLPSKTVTVKPAPTPVIKEEKDKIVYPSRRIYAAKDNNIVINLPNTGFKRYVVRFFDEDQKSIFELNKIKDDFLIIEKVNFLHAGWFYFEIFENGKLIEKNKFLIAK